MRKSKSASELKELLIDYAPNKQVYLCKDKDLCYFGMSPTLAEINREYSELAATAFLVPQLTNLAEFANCKTSFGEGQIRSCAEMIASEYYFLKISEIMLFCYKFKSGEYGQFYGSVSPMTIMVALKQFARERNDIISQHESEERQKEREKAKEKLISAREYYKDKVQALTWRVYAISYVIRLLLGFTDKKVQQ